MRPNFEITGRRQAQLAGGPVDCGVDPLDMTNKKTFHLPEKTGNRGLSLIATCTAGQGPGSNVFHVQNLLIEHGPFGLKPWSVP